MDSGRGASVVCELHRLCCDGPEFLLSQHFIDSHRCYGALGGSSDSELHIPTRVAGNENSVNASPLLAISLDQSIVIDSTTELLRATVVPVRNRKTLHRILASRRFQKLFLHVILLVPSSHNACGSPLHFMNF
jgi:hypothetical protein